MYKPNLIYTLAAAALTFGLGCGDDGGESTVDAAPARDGTVATVDAMTGAPDAAVDAGPTAAATFCSSFSTVCGYDDQNAGRFDNEAACLDLYNSLGNTRTACVTTHLGLAADDVDLHCPHAMGTGPCAGGGGGGGG